MVHTETSLSFVLSRTAQEGAEGPGLGRDMWYCTSPQGSWVSVPAPGPSVLITCPLFWETGKVGLVLTCPLPTAGMNALQLQNLATLAVLQPQPRPQPPPPMQILCPPLAGCLELLTSPGKVVLPLGDRTRGSAR